MSGRFLKCEHCEKDTIPISDEIGIEADVCPNCDISIFASPQDVINNKTKKSHTPKLVHEESCPICETTLEWDTTRECDNCGYDKP